MGWGAQVEDGDERGVGRVVNRADRRLYSGRGGSGPRRSSECPVMKAVTRVTFIETERGVNDAENTEREQKPKKGKRIRNIGDIQ